jgi:outer membrane protein TolC
MNKTKLTILAALFFSSSLFAQTKDSTYTFTMQQAIDYACQHQKSIVNAQIDEKIADAQVGEVRGTGLPQISASFDIKDYLTLNYLFPAVFSGGKEGAFEGVPIATPSYAATLGAQASQLLFSGSYLVGLKAAKTYRELSQKTLARTRIDVEVAVSKAYYGALVNRQRIQLLDANVTRVQKLKDDTKALYDNGFVEKIDYDRVVLTYNNLITERENVNRMLALSDYLLKFQMGMGIYSTVILADSLNNEQLKNISISPEKPDITKRIEYSLLQSQKRFQEFDLKKEKSLYTPTLMLVGSAYTMKQTADVDVFANDRWYPTGYIGATLTLPIFDGLSREKKIDEAKLGLKKIDNEFADMTNALSMETESNRTMLQNAIATLNTQQANLDLAGEVVRVSKLKYDQGVGSNLEVITAESSLREAQTNYYNALYDALVAKVDLDKALGNIK